MQKRLCPLTERDGPTRRLAYAPRPWELAQCLETGFVFLANPPAYEAFREDYAWERTSRRESERRRASEPVLHTVSSRFKALRRRLLRRDKVCDLALVALRGSQRTVLRLLDLGCGRGGLLRRVMAALPEEQRRHCVPYGIELSSQLAESSQEKLAQVGGSCVNDTALNGIGRFPADHFHLVTLSSFLEHEINPVPLLRACRERLAPGWHIVVKVPNFASVNRVLRGARWCGFRWPDHVNYFTPATLRAAAARAGLAVARFSAIDAHPFSDNMYAVLVRPPA